MRVFWVVLACVGLVGIGLMIVSRNRGGQLVDGQAGKAYIETEDGTLIENDGTRGAQRTVIPKKPEGMGADEEWLTKFELTERSGDRIGSEDLKGQPYVAGFFFSTCPSICVRQNSKVQQLQEQFKGQSIRFLSISCDPEVDSPEVLNDYAKRFDADDEQWLFMTGNMTYIRRVGSEIFSLGVVRRGHPEKFALMDAAGEMVGLYTWSDDGQWSALQTDIQKLLDAGGAFPSKTEMGLAEPKPVQEDEASEGELVNENGSPPGSGQP